MFYWQCPRTFRTTLVDIHRIFQGQNEFMIQLYISGVSFVAKYIYIVAISFKYRTRVYLECLFSLPEHCNKLLCNSKISFSVTFNNNQTCSILLNLIRNPNSYNLIVNVINLSSGKLICKHDFNFVSLMLVIHNSDACIGWVKQLCFPYKE